ncbi:hypothetical protein [Polynucleobacter sp.]|uniref:hypothetical protein n=1 Tax=Polynucleobacter sp. TaxID=2029855 RepID=UPI00260342BF|nr:hypothetical protein [Polynucleobacter sp.]
MKHDDSFKNWLTFFVAMHHCYKDFAVLQQLFAAKQQNMQINEIYCLNSMGYIYEEAIKNPAFY